MDLRIFGADVKGKGQGDETFSLDLFELFPKSRTQFYFCLIYSFPIKYCVLEI